MGKNKSAKKIEAANPYNTWKKVKDLRLGSRSKKVYLLSNPRNPSERIVMKQYDALDKHHRGRYNKEIRVLERLHDFPHAPHLLYKDDVKCTMWMTYCGKVAPMNAQTKAEVERILRALADKWGVHRVANGQERRLDAESIFPKNITELKGVIFSIDYGSASWILTPRPNAPPI
jgi:hypothetical protein